MGIREDVLALAEELDGVSLKDDCESCLASGTSLCRGDLECAESAHKACAKRLREIVEHDAGEVTTVSAYDLLPDEDRKAIAWVREMGGVEAAKARMMPEGCEWPRYEDGTPVWFGDEASRLGEVFKVSGIGLYLDGSYALNFRAYSKDERVKRPAPKVLDADGVEIRVGDVLYSVETDGSVTVDSIEPGNPWFATTDGALQHCAKFTHRAPVIAADGKPLRVGETVYEVEGTGHAYRVVGIRVGDGDPLTPTVVTCDVGDFTSEHFLPSQLTHEQPDTWEKWREDSELSPIDYCVMIGYPPSEEESAELIKNRDLVRRARKLAERGEL